MSPVALCLAITSPDWTTNMQSPGSPCCAMTAPSSYASCSQNDKVSATVWVLTGYGRHAVHAELVSL